MALESQPVETSSNNAYMTPQHPTPTVSVIILNWNGEKILSRFLPEVVANTPEKLAGIIVADNGSDDRSIEMLTKRFPQVDIIAFGNNHGFAQGYNLAIRNIDSPYTVLLNSDAAPAEGWLEPLLNHMESHPDTAACQPKILSAENPGQFEYAGASGGFLDRNGYPYCRGRIFSTIENDKGQYDSVTNIDWASGAALMIRTELYRRAGGLDPLFFAHMEEIDLCWRLRLMGYSIDAVPASTVYHLGGGSLGAGNPHKTYLNFRNNLLLLYKNLPRKKRRAVLLRRRLLDTLAWARFLFSADLKNAGAVLKAHIDFRKMKKQYDFLPNNPFCDYPALPEPQNDLLQGRPDILTSYYLRHRRFFSALDQ